MGQRESVIHALVEELALRRDYLGEQPLTSIYFGGGTPSLLNASELDRLFGQIYRSFSVETGAEVTLEANPDDLTAEKVRQLRATPVNRFSIGIQSFFEEDLRFMNRAHDARQARSCIEHARAAGFHNLTIDLIYGSPTTTDARWAENLRIAIGYDIPHLSSYCLTVEERTALAHFVATGKAPPVDDDQAARQFDILVAAMAEAGYDHYEISNFARPGWYARHNSAYWRGAPYLGVGPSAHSFDGRSRQWNVANNALYVKAVAGLKSSEPAATLLFEREVLTPAQRYNEYVMTGLRTSWGVELAALRRIAPSFETHFLQHIQPYLDAGSVEREEDTFRLTPAGKFLADGIAAGVFA